MWKSYLTVLMIGLLANPAFADCTYNGKQYPEGTVIGPYVCDGDEWVDK